MDLFINIQWMAIIMSRKKLIMLGMAVGSIKVDILFASRYNKRILFIHLSPRETYSDLS